MYQNDICIIGYSGHSYVAIDILQLNRFSVQFYCDQSEKISNPFNLKYLGREEQMQADLFKMLSFFIGIGDNLVRNKLFKALAEKNASLINAIHPNTTISSTATLGYGVMLAAGTVINPLVQVGNGVICNTNSSIDHECKIGDFTHIAPGSVLCGNVTIGENTFIGAGSVIKEGITIGNNVIVGAGSVVISNILDGKKVVGCPAKEMSSKR